MSKMSSVLLFLLLSSAASSPAVLASPSTTSSRHLQDLALTPGCASAMALLADDNGMKAANATKMNEIASLRDNCDDDGDGSRNCQINTGRLASASPYVTACENADGIVTTIALSVTCTDVEIVLNDLYCMPLQCADTEVDKYMEELELSMATDLALESGASDCRLNVDHGEQESSGSWRASVTLVWRSVLFGMLVSAVW